MRTGIDQSVYSRLERGEKVLTLHLCKKLALAFDTSADYLLHMTNEQKPYPRSDEIKDILP